MFIKKKFAPEKMKKHHSKLLIIGLQFLFSLLAQLPKRPKNRNPVTPKVPKCRTGYLDWGYCNVSAE